MATTVAIDTWRQGKNMKCRVTRSNREISVRFELAALFSYFNRRFSVARQWQDIIKENNLAIFWHFSLPFGDEGTSPVEISFLSSDRSTGASASRIFRWLSLPSSDTLIGVSVVDYGETTFRVISFIYLVTSTRYSLEFDGVGTSCTENLKLAN